MEAAGQEAEEPEQEAARVSVPLEQLGALHWVPALWKLSAGQAGEEPVQVSAASQEPAEARQTVLGDRLLQVPFWAAPAAVLQAWQSEVSPPPQAVLQQTPSTQLPEEHWLAAEQEVPLPLWVVQVPLLQ